MSRENKHGACVKTMYRGNEGGWNEKEWDRSIEIV
jgi:hypothetical protein